MIFWEGGVKFGLLLSVLTFVYNLLLHRQDFFPLWPVQGRVLFSWFWWLIVNPAVFFVLGCLFGLFMWEFMRLLKRNVRKNQSALNRSIF